MMKHILKWLAIVIGAIIVTLLLIGFLHPTYEDSVTTTVKAPVDKTFAIFQDTQKMKEWIPGYLSTEIIEGQMGQPGSKYKLTFDQNGSPFEMMETITYFEKNRRFSFDLKDDHGLFHVDVEFSPTEDGTEITETMTGRANGIFGKAITHLMKGRIVAQKQEMYESLAKVVERSNWTPQNAETSAPIMKDSSTVTATDPN